MLVEKFGDNVFPLGDSKLIGQSATSKLYCRRSRPMEVAKGQASYALGSLERVSVG